MGLADVQEMMVEAVLPETLVEAVLVVLYCILFPSNMFRITIELNRFRVSDDNGNIIEQAYGDIYSAQVTSFDLVDENEGKEEKEAI